ncbi:unnamed protein product [Soboliphyme baturini]|uniref:Uncharacterized protein n=1 Tax=Soboliphyme baturini TaxID=241478 RepID=A0A183ITN0_9BILA|nr:unnamed protein product [Soboliphyme baturini]
MVTCSAFRLPVRNFSTWERYYLEMSSCELYTDDQLVESILKELAMAPIASVENMEGGTQIKLLITFANNSSAVAKPMR